jgi:hypothetical protein
MTSHTSRKLYVRTPFLYNFFLMSQNNEALSANVWMSLVPLSITVSAVLILAAFKSGAVAQIVGNAWGRMKRKLAPNDVEAQNG